MATIVLALICVFAVFLKLPCDVGLFFNFSTVCPVRKMKGQSDYSLAYLSSRGCLKVSKGEEGSELILNCAAVVGMEKVDMVECVLF